MAENKTRPTKANVEAYLATIGDETRRSDCKTLIRVMKKATGKAPRMWGSIVGFGEYHYRGASGREGQWFLTGFASRKADLTMYILDGAKKYPKLLARIGKYRVGKGCLYVKKLADIDTTVLEQMVTASVRYMRSQYECS